MNKEELDAIRVKALLEPEGSPARVLLAEVDRLNEEAWNRVRKDIQERFQLTGLEVEKLIERLSLNQVPEMKLVQCLTCKGRGFTYELGCLGESKCKCHRCHGTGTMPTVIF